MARLVRMRSRALARENGLGSAGTGLWARFEAALRASSTDANDISVRLHHESTTTRPTLGLDRRIVGATVIRPDSYFGLFRARLVSPSRAWEQRRTPPPARWKRASIAA